MYQGKMAYEQWESELQARGASLNNAIKEAYILFKKFYDLTYGKTPTEIANMDQFASTYPTVDGDEGVNLTKRIALVTALQGAINILADFHKAMNNEAVGQADRFGYLVKFL